MKNEIKKGSLVIITNPRLSWRKKFKGMFGEITDVLQDLSGDPVFMVSVVQKIRFCMTFHIGEIKLADKSERFLHAMDRKLICRD